MTAGCPNRQRRHTPSSWTTPNPDTTQLGLYFQQPAKPRRRPKSASAWKAPLHRHDAAGVAAGGDDAELGAGRRERSCINTRPVGGLFDIAGAFRATCELLFQEALRALAAVTLLRLG